MWTGHLQNTAVDSEPEGRCRRIFVTSQVTFEISRDAFDGPDYVCVAAATAAAACFASK